MVKIRLTRKGRKNAPAYRIVVADSRAKRDGKFIEIIGYYNPTEDPEKVVYKKERYDYWISVGAQPTKAVKKLISGNYKFEPYNPDAKKDEENETDESNETPENDKVENIDNQTTQDEGNAENTDKTEKKEEKTDESKEDKPEENTDK